MPFVQEKGLAETIQLVTADWQSGLYHRFYFLASREHSVEPLCFHLLFPGAPE